MPNIYLSQSIQIFHHLKTTPSIGSTNPSYLYKRIVQAKLFMDNHFNENIDLENIANEAYFSKFHFIRLFKMIYGKTPHQYLIQVRVEQARRLLCEGRSVSDTCTAVGFESITSFTALFKKLSHQSPSVFQATYFKREDEIRKEPLRFIPSCFAEQTGWTKKSNFQEAL